VNLFEFGQITPLISFAFLFKNGNDVVNNVMSSQTIQDFMKSNEKFDVCVVENFNVDAFVVGHGIDKR
jgi:hypothetical protein